MKKYLLLSMAAILLHCRANAQQLNAAEYFFDTDPGVRNGTSLSVAVGDSIVYSGNISTSGLPNGFHFLYLRAQNTDGVWSLQERRLFYIASVPIAASLTSAESFFDVDPGTGNGNTLTVLSGDSILFNGSIGTSGLQNGFHFLYVRVKNADGSWSLSERRTVYIQNPPAVAPVLVAAEYFVNTDPGIGSATPIVVIPGDSILFSGPLAIANTSVGFDSLYIRVMNLSGVWSLYEPRGFEISTTISVDEIPMADHAVLFQNYPNPFTQATTIEYYLQKPGDVSFYITDILGRSVRVIRVENNAEGKNSIFIDNSSLGEGYYFYKMVASDFTDTKRMTVLK